MKTYTVVAKTADKADAGSSMSIWITLHGKSGRTATRKKLDTSTNDFERGKTDTFHIETDDVGDLDLVVLTCAGGDAWEGEWLAVTRDADHRKWKFPIRSVMSGDLSEGKDLLVLKPA